MRSRSIDSFFFPTIFWIVVGGGLLIGSMVGCTTPARREVYEQKILSEVRNLEDQLYEADYENRVLRDELNACREKKDCPPRNVTVAVPAPPEQLPPVASGRVVVPPPVAIDTVDQTPTPVRSDPASPATNTFEPPARVIDAAPPLDAAPMDDLGSDFDPLDIDLGEPIDASQDDLDDGTPPSQPKRETIPAPLRDPPARDDSSPRTDKSENSDRDPPRGFDRDALTNPFENDDLPPAPARPTPPGVETLRPDPIIEGDVLPPPMDPEKGEGPAGKIELPELSRTKQTDGDLAATRRTEPTNLPTGAFDDSAFFGTPTGIKIDPRGGGRMVDGTAVLDVLIVVVDDRERPVDLSRFDVDAQLMLTVIDPAATLPASDEPVQLGRWTFDNVQTASLVKDNPSGFHVPIQFESRQPAGDTVQIAVALRQGKQVMTDTATLPTNADARVAAGVAAEWLPRGDAPSGHRR